MTAEAILYKENDPLLRYAIYKAYKYRCAYTGKFLYDYSSMHLDHIIPQNTAPEVLQEKIRKYHLADDFTIDSSDISSRFPNWPCSTPRLQITARRRT